MPEAMEQLEAARDQLLDDDDGLDDLELDGLELASVDDQKSLG